MNPVVERIAEKIVIWVYTLIKGEPTCPSVTPQSPVVSPPEPARITRIPLAPPKAISFNGIAYEDLSYRGVRDEMAYLNQAISAAEARHREERAAGPDSDETWSASQQVSRLYAQRALLRPFETRYQRR